MKVWKKTLLMLVTILLLVTGTAFAYVSTIWNTTKGTLKSTYTDLGSKKSSIVADKPLSILLMGVDTGDSSRGGSQNWNGNSDSQIVLTLNPKTKTATMVSMERDTMTNIVDENGNKVSQQKMNAAYPFGYNAGGLNSAALYAMNTIGQQAGLKLDNFVAINMDGLISLINDVGGIDVNNDSGSDIYIYNTEPEYKAVVPPGKQHINGEQALVFARDRDTLPNGDYGRAAHQREVLSQLSKKLVNLSNISQYEKFLKDISNDIKTNIAVDSANLPKLIAYKDCFNKIVSIQYQGIGDTAAGSDGTAASYQFMPKDVDLAVQNLMRNSIGESIISDLDANIVSYESYYGVQPTGYFLPSASVTEGGKTKTYGVNVNGELVKITDDNANQYVSTNGSPLSSSSTSSGSSSVEASSGSSY